MTRKTFIVASLLALLAFLIPIEHKYDKLFRFFSLTLIPDGLFVSDQYDKKIYFYLSDLIVLSLPFFGFLSIKKWVQNPLWLVWICALISIIVSPFAHYPIPYFRLIQLFAPFALFSFIANSEKDFTRAILYGIVLAGLFQTAIGITQYFHQAPLGLRFLGEVKQISTFHTPEESRWLLDELFGIKMGTRNIMRAAGTFSHANVFGGFLVFSILATYLLALRNRVWLFALPLQFFAMALSFSRAALFAWGLSSFLWFALMLYQKRLKQMVPIIAVMTFAFTTTAVLLYQQYFYRGGVVNYNKWVQDSDYVRRVQQNTAIEIIKDNLWSGLGFTQFSERSSSYLQNIEQNYIRVTAPHNIFLFLTCEMGIFALFAFVLFLAHIFWKFLRSPLNIESSLFASLLIAFVFIGFCDFYFILFQQGRLMFFLVTALLVANTQKHMVHYLDHEQSYPRKRLENV